MSILGHALVDGTKDNSLTRGDSDASTHVSRIVTVGMDAVLASGGQFLSCHVSLELPHPFSHSRTHADRPFALGDPLSRCDSDPHLCFCEHAPDRRFDARQAIQRVSHPIPS